MIRALLIDDEAPARRVLLELLQAHADIDVFADAPDVAGGLCALAAHKPDVVLLDIRLRGETGIDFLAAAPAPLPCIIFVTAYDQYAVRAFECNAMDYLLKPVEPERLALSLDRVRRGIAPPTPPMTETDSIFLKDGRLCEHCDDGFVPVISEATRIHPGCATFTRWKRENSNDPAWTRFRKNPNPTVSDSESKPEGIRDYKPPPRGFKTDRWFNFSDGNDQMHATRKSDGSIIPAKSANKGTSEMSAEWMELRDPAERNAAQPAPPRTLSRNQVESSGLDRVRGTARKDGDLKFTALLHHADVDALRRSFFKLKKTAAVGIVGITWQDYGQALEENLINHDWLIVFLECRIGDRRVLRLIRNWLEAGVSEDGKVTKASVGTPQGAVI